MRKRHYQQSATSSVTDAFNSIQLHDDSKMLAEQSSQDPRIKIKTKRAAGAEFLAPVAKKREQSLITVELQERLHFKNMQAKKSAYEDKPTRGSSHLKKSSNLLEKKSGSVYSSTVYDFRRARVMNSSASQETIPKQRPKTVLGDAYASSIDIQPQLALSSVALVGRKQFDRSLLSEPLSASNIRIN